MFRDKFADNLGISQTRKEQIYLDICKAVTLQDVSYWIQVLFAAGIATLGLVLNSPAVIIGAMLISPLMGGILANGLALAAGDVILAMRALINLIVSCIVAISFAVLLVSLLPFKEMTAEIAARIRPNILDLVVALFSGAVGSVAICKEPTGVATSIPGVAIAVALMPPLCVVGYGIGIAISSDFLKGLQVASGGGLLFFTNLVAITFTAMLVFLALNIDNNQVREKVKEWRENDPESLLMQHFLEKLPAYNRLKKVGGLPGRFLLIFSTIGMISFPLNQSLIQLRKEITLQQQENKIRGAATEIWQTNFANFSNGDPRSYISNISTTYGQNNKLLIQLQVFSSKQYTPEEQQQYIQLLANRLNKVPELLGLKLVEIPTASNELLRKIAEEKTAETAITIAQLQANFLQEIQTSLGSLVLPEPAKLLDYEIITSPIEPLKIRLIYLSDREISKDAQIIIADNIRAKLDYQSAKVSMQRIDANAGFINFANNKATLTVTDTQILDRIGQTLQRQPNLSLEVTINQKLTNSQKILPQRSQIIVEYLKSKWQIAENRINIQIGIENQGNAKLKLIV
ncbi:MAG: DUF389 domain-containing protein [Nostocales cyanobacterium]|nr:MAG: DUF389 domain-containing protein [Nostocales cyanobacterium]